MFDNVGRAQVVWVGIALGFLLNLTGWVGNNFLLGSLWSELVVPDTGAVWRASIWRDVFSFVPDYVYGIGIAWLIPQLRPRFSSWMRASLAAGMFVALIGGLTTYFAIANSGFIGWNLGLASVALVLATKLPLSVGAGWILEPHPDQ
ncbi:MAG: hypothetical protein PVJ04_02800 [Gemmatimonadota bacterium]